jgi:hypothetical protein
MSPYKVWNDWEDKEELITIPRGTISQYVPLLSFFSFFPYDVSNSLFRNIRYKKTLENYNFRIC